MERPEFQIRLCLSCGLRYPVENGYKVQDNCPVCMADDTQLVGMYPLQNESWVPFKDPSLHVETLLDNVRSAWSVGSIFRTADGFGLKHLYLCGITPTPEFNRVRRTSLGAEETVAWTYHKDSVLILQALREQGYKLLALAHDMRAVSIKEIALARRRRKGDTEESKTVSRPAAQSAQLRKISPDDKIALVIGNEVTGIDPDLLNRCDDIVYIPIRGNEKSINVAIAFAVAVSQLVL